MSQDILYTFDLDPVKNTYDQKTKFPAILGKIQVLFQKKKLCLIVQYVMEYTTARAAATRYLFTLRELCLFL